MTQTTDADGLSDYDETDIYETNPKNPDTDSDGLRDGFEADIGFDPSQANADGDSRPDLVEWQKNSNPYVYDKTKKEYINSFVKGFFAGDFIQDAEDFPMLAGQITSSCIPLVDVRDVAGNLYHGNFGMATLSAIGLVPVGGDAAKAGSKLAKFALKNADNAPEVVKGLELLAKIFPDAASKLSKSDEVVKALKRVTDKDLSKLTKTESKVLREFLEKMGLKSLVDYEGRLLRFSNWDDMKKAFKGTVIAFVKEQKPKYAPRLNKWFKAGGIIEIENKGGQQIWTFISKAGDKVPYVDGIVKFPEEYLYMGIKDIDIGKFTGDRKKDTEKLIEVLIKDYGIDTGIPKGYAVHHDSVNGIIQLVREDIHKLFTHIGGHALNR